MRKGSIEYKLSEVISEFVDHIRDDDADELALRVMSVLRENGTILTKFTEAPKYILMLQLEETKEQQLIENKINDPERNLKIVF